MTQTAKLTASDASSYDYFGRSVSINRAPASRRMFLKGGVAIKNNDDGKCLVM